MLRIEKFADLALEHAPVHHVQAAAQGGEVLRIGRFLGLEFHPYDGALVVEARLVEVFALQDEERCLVVQHLYRLFFTRVVFALLVEVHRADHTAFRVYPERNEFLPFGNLQRFAIHDPALCCSC